MPDPTSLNFSFFTFQFKHLFSCPWTHPAPSDLRAFAHAHIFARKALQLQFHPSIPSLVVCTSSLASSPQLDQVPFTVLSFLPLCHLCPSVMTYLGNYFNTADQSSYPTRAGIMAFSSLLQPLSYTVPKEGPKEYLEILYNKRNVDILNILYICDIKTPIDFFFLISTDKRLQTFRKIYK